MMKLAAMLWIVIGSMLAGALVIVALVVPSLPLSVGLAIAVAAVVGYILAIPAAILLSKKLLSLN